MKGSTPPLGYIGAPAKLSSLIKCFSSSRDKRLVNGIAIGTAALSGAWLSWKVFSLIRRGMNSKKLES
ncbi:hypothetical protein TrRE_jg3169, partial [Triparma retinervis]